MYAPSHFYAGRKLTKAMKKLLLALLIGFGIYGYIENNAGVTPSSTKGETSGSRSIANAYQQRRSGAQVGGSGQVIRVLPDDNDGSRHPRFINLPVAR